MHPAAHSVLPNVRSIVALRPNAIGDYMFSLPALHALRHTYPDAHITLLGKQWHADFLRGRPGPVDEVIVMPPVPGVGADPDAVVDPGPARELVESLRTRCFDIAVQMFGGGRYSNGFINQLGARLTVGARTAGAAPLDRAIAYGEFPPCVGIFWLTNVMEACPLAQHLLRPAVSVRTHCPVCGIENRKRRCAHDVCFVDDVPAEEVTAVALDLFEQVA